MFITTFLTFITTFLPECLSAQLLIKIPLIITFISYYHLFRHMVPRPASGPQTPLCLPAVCR